MLQTLQQQLKKVKRSVTYAERKENELILNVQLKSEEKEKESKTRKNKSTE